VADAISGFAQAGDIAPLRELLLPGEKYPSVMIESRSEYTPG
jgi:hypothetical protein